MPESPVANVSSGDKRKPERIVGDSRTNAASRGRVPPMLDVSLGTGGPPAQDMGSRLLGSGMEERHDILKLIAKPIGAARLVKGGTPQRDSSAPGRAASDS